VISWSDTEIVVEFSACGESVEVNSVFGTATATASETAQGWGTASVIGVESESPSEIGNYLYFLLIPAGSVLLWRCRRRRG
jgi:hypothetical protein